MSQVDLKPFLGRDAGIWELQRSRDTYVIWDSLMAISKYKLIVRISGVLEEALEDFRSQETTWVLG